jgi:NAD(P)-dependent dehydrogenase (short-subunit alcohol dehydrogenase family)
MDIPDPFDFTGATALIVGGAAGLGRAMAEGLADRGASVCIVARTEARARKAADAIAMRLNSPCHACTADFTSEDSVNALGEEVNRLFEGRLNVAVNCAGINVRNPIERITLPEWESVQRVNSTGAFLFARAMYPCLKRAGWGRLINVTSIFASRSFRYRSSYASSKGAMLQLTRTLAIEWAGENITVNAISPGPFLTDMTLPLLNDQEAYRQFCANIPIGRFAEPREIVTACLFLASRASSYVTGADVAVDGGWMAT